MSNAKTKKTKAGATAKRAVYGAQAARRAPQTKKLPKRYAVIDIGSVAARLQIATVSDGQLLTEVFTRIPLQLGGYVFNTGGGGRLPVAQCRRLALALAGMRRLIDSMKPCGYMAVATAALRDCANREQALRIAREEAGVNIRVLSGRAEARVIGLYAAGHFRERYDTVINADIGGGSTDCVAITNGRLRAAETFMLGTARKRGGAAAERARLGEWLARHTQHTQHSAGGGGAVISASGGSAFQLQQRIGALTAARLARFEREAAGMSRAALAAKYDLSPDRAAHTVDALELYRIFIGSARERRLRAIRGGLSEALLAEKLGAPARAEA